jgi:photosystem II stability/assembly factor-like uncharacterized protein
VNRSVQPRLSGRCSALLGVAVGALAALALWPASALALGAQAGCGAQVRGVNTWYNSVDVVGKTGWAVGTGGAVVRWSAKNGATKTFKVGSKYDLQAVDFVTAKIGYAVSTVKGGEAVVFKSTNGGAAWKRKMTAKVDVLAAVRFASSTVGWVAGRSGTILKTTNGGKKWTAQKSGTGETLYALSVVSSKVCYAAGSSGVILKTTNGGKKWSTQASGTQDDLYGMDCVSAKVGWVVGGDTAGVCLKTTSGGKTWNPIGDAGLPPLEAVDFISVSTGWVIGNAGTYPSIAGKIYKLTGGGSTWTDQSADVDQGAPDYGLLALRCVSGPYCCAAGEHEASLYTTNGTDWHLAHIATR